MTRLRPLLISAAATLGISLLAPAGSSAANPPASGNRGIVLPQAELVQQVPILNPSDVVVPDYTFEAYALSKGDPSKGIPPRVLKGRVQDTIEGPRYTFDAHLDLPAGSNPQTIDVNEEGLLVIADAERRRFIFVDPRRLAIVEDVAFPPGFDSSAGIAAGFQTQVALDSGEGDGAGIFYGPGFASQLSVTGITLKGIGHLPLGPPEGGVIPALFAFAANTGEVGLLSDAPVPASQGKLPGPPGLSAANPPGDLAIGPLNLNSDPKEAELHTGYVPVPGWGQVWQSVVGLDNWTLFAETTGDPTRMAVGCESALVTVPTEDVIKVFELTPTKGAICAQIAELGVRGEVTRKGKLPVEVKAYLTPTAAEINAVFFPGVFKRKAGAIDVRASARGKVRSKTKKLKLQAGRVTKAKLKFKRRARAALAAALERRRKVKGKLKLRVTSPTGEKAKVKSKLVLKRR